MIPGFKSVLVPDYSIPVPPPPQPPPVIILQQRREARGKRLSISKRRRYKPSVYSQPTQPAAPTPGGDETVDVDMEGGPIALSGPVPPPGVFSLPTATPMPTPISMITTHRSMLSTPVSMRTTQPYSPPVVLPQSGDRFSPAPFNPYDFFRGGARELADIYDQLDRYDRRRRSRLQVVDATPERQERRRPQIDLVSESPMLERGYFQPPPAIRRRVFGPTAYGPPLVKGAVEGFI